MYVIDFDSKGLEIYSCGISISPSEAADSRFAFLLNPERLGGEEESKVKIPNLLGAFKPWKLPEPINNVRRMKKKKKRDKLDSEEFKRIEEEELKYLNEADEDEGQVDAEDDEKRVDGETGDGSAKGGPVRTLVEKMAGVEHSAQAIVANTPTMAYYLTGRELI